MVWSWHDNVFCFPAPPVQQSLRRVHRPWDEGASHRHDQQLLSRQPEHQTRTLRCESWKLLASYLSFFCVKFAQARPYNQDALSWKGFFLPVMLTALRNRDPVSSLELITFCYCKDAEARALAKERQKKDNHNLSKCFTPFVLLHHQTHTRARAQLNLYVHIVIHRLLQPCTYLADTVRVSGWLTW